MYKRQVCAYVMTLCLSLNKRPVYYVFYARHSFVNDVWRCWPMKQTYLEPVFVGVTILSVLIRTYTAGLEIISLSRNCVVAGKNQGNCITHKNECKKHRNTIICYLVYHKFDIRFFVLSQNPLNERFCVETQKLSLTHSHFLKGSAQIWSHNPL